MDAMTQQQQSLVNDVLSLPVDGQRQVAQFVATLKQQQQPATNGDLSSDPFIGMWKDHSDLTDSSDWVRNVRRNEW